MTARQPGPRQLTFFTELEGEPLSELFTKAGLISQLAQLQARVSMGILDFSAERAAVVRRLNAAGIPLVAWQLLPREQGYWYHLGSADYAVVRYQQFRDWSREEKLHWDTIGIDIEPDINEFQELLRYNLRTLKSLFRRLWDKTLFAQSAATYGSLVGDMHADGYAVHGYEYFFVADERVTGSSMLSQLFGLAPVTPDRHVGMLYSSFFRPFGPAMLRAYAAEFDSVAIGITGGGIEVDGMQAKAPMTWDEFARDLRIAGRDHRDVHVFSLEGCVRQGFLQRLNGFDWEQEIPAIPKRWRALVAVTRYLGLACLWLFARPALLLGAVAVILWVTLSS